MRQVYINHRYKMVSVLRPNRRGFYPRATLSSRARLWRYLSSRAHDWLMTYCNDFTEAYGYVERGQR